MTDREKTAATVELLNEVRNFFSYGEAIGDEDAIAPHAREWRDELAAKVAKHLGIITPDDDPDRNEAGREILEEEGLAANQEYLAEVAAQHARGKYDYRSPVGSFEDEIGPEPDPDPLLVRLNHVTEDRENLRAELEAKTAQYADTLSTLMMQSREMMKCHDERRTLIEAGRCLAITAAAAVDFIRDEDEVHGAAIKSSLVNVVDNWNQYVPAQSRVITSMIPLPHDETDRTTLTSFVTESA